MKNWNTFFFNEIHKPEIRNLIKKVSLDYQTKVIFPPKPNILNAFKLCPFDKVKVIIVGQDPYHEVNQAMGLSFSVNDGVKVPPSLVNIFKEYNSDLGYSIPQSGNLENWAKNGVLLLNSILSVEEGKAFSCNYKEYSLLFIDVIKYLNESTKPLVFILWGNSAAKVSKYIDDKKHLVIKGCHPSPLSCYRGFFNSKPFSKCNEFLIKNHLEIVDWKLK